MILEVDLKVCVRCGLIVARDPAHPVDSKRTQCPGCSKDLEPLKAAVRGDGSTVVFYTECE